ncbi:MAG: tRNA-specific 2-thiouridylase, partial [Pygmaiobacter sp.]
MLDTASKRVLVGMSGGVDSSVCVKLLREEGFVVEGAVIRFSPAHEGAVEQARQVAAQLDVPLRVLDCCTEFETSVIQPFCESYCHGKTPNPCILCNPRVKFSALARAADDMGIHCIASGHYARIAKTDRGFAVQKAASTARDQSYMLYRLSQDILARLLLPLGAFEKPEIRAMARAMGLCCADAPDSQEICFIPDGDYASYIAQRGGSWLTGHFIAPDGTDLGAHKGVVHYTVGQRKGLGLSLNAPAFIKRIREDGN